MSAGYIPLTAAGHDIPTHFSLLGRAPNLRQRGLPFDDLAASWPCCVAYYMQTIPAQACNLGQDKGENALEAQEAENSRCLGLGLGPLLAFCPRLLIPQACAPDQARPPARPLVRRRLPCLASRRLGLTSPASCWSLARLGHLVPDPPSLPLSPLFRHASRSPYRPRGKALGWKELDAQQLDRRLLQSWLVQRP